MKPTSSRLQEPGSYGTTPGPMNVLKTILYGFAIPLIALLLTSCPNPLPVDLAAQITDGDGPVITVTCPVDGEAYGATVTVAGTIVDEGGTVSELVLQVEAIGVHQTLNLAENGLFSHTVPTAELAETLALVLTATDWNGNTTEISLQLIPNTEGPVFTIISPADEAEYLSTVPIRGSVSDNDSQIDSVQLEIKAADVEESLPVAEDGSFTYDLDTTGVSRTIITTITANDSHGNVSTATRTLFNDELGPHIQIAEPEDYSAYSTVVRVSGAVTDAQEVNTTGEVASAHLTVPGTNVATHLTLGADGAFAYEFATRLGDGTQILTGPATIEITAKDWNGNSTTQGVTITNSATGDVPSVTVTPANKQVTIEWDPVLYAESYSVHNPRYGQIREDVPNPYVWDGLINGELYSFQVQALLPDEAGVDAWSNRQDAIPLSERTLAPWVTETGYRSITIGWNGADGASEYVVERSENSGPWLVRTLTGNTTTTDTDLAHDTWYAYRVTPVEQADIVSASGLHVMEMCIPASPTRVGGYDTAGEALGVAVSDSYTYVADRSAGLQVIDISIPASPTRVGGYDTADDAVGVAISGSYAYVADDGAGLQIIDISIPDSPTRVGGYDTADDAQAVAISGSYAYVADYTAGLQVFDISIPAFPTRVGDTAGTARGVAVSGSYAYVAAGSVGLQVIDISDPASPTLLGACDTSGSAYGVAVSGSYAAVADYDGGLAVIDIADPDSPTLVGGYDTAGYAQGVAVSGSYAYVADHGAGLQVIDISIPASPTLVGGYDTVGYAYGVAVSGSYAYVADLGAGLQVIDISIPASPTRVGGDDTPGAARGVAVSGSYAYVAGDTVGLQVIKLTGGP